MRADEPDTGYREKFPLFPLHTVLLPGVHLPLHIFEPRYRQLIADLISGAVPDREFGVLAIKNALTNDVDGAEQVHEIGCTALLREAEPLDGGRFDVVTTGHRRFRLHELSSIEAPYLVGTVEWLPDLPSLASAGTTTVTLAAAARAAHERYCEAAWQDGDWQAPPVETELSHLGYLMAADCLLPLADRQALLAERDALHRLRLVAQLLTREAGFLGALRAVPAPHSGLGELGTAATLN
ncbi:MAG: peptidase [Actinophytocola sp.]|nr:peptidase [Actinophytocola sp.]